MAPIRRQRGDWVVVPPSASSPPPLPLVSSPPLREDSVIGSPHDVEPKHYPPKEDDDLYSHEEEADKPRQQEGIKQPSHDEDPAEASDEDSDLSSDDEESIASSDEDAKSDRSYDSDEECGPHSDDEAPRPLSRESNANRSPFYDDTPAARFPRIDDGNVRPSVEVEKSSLFSDDGSADPSFGANSTVRFSGEESVDLSILNLASFGDFEARGAINELVHGYLASTVFQYRAHSGTYYSGKIRRIRWHIKFEKAVDCLRRIPDEEIYPLMDWELPVVTAIGQRNLHIQYPAVVSWACDSSGTTQVAERFLAEAKTLERLRQSPHRNVLQYLGCLVGRGRLIGLVSPKYELDLYEWLCLDGQTPRYKLEAVFAELKRGVRHMHALGLAHNSIEPEHILMRKDEEGGYHPVLAHMGHALPFGNTLRGQQTSLGGWTDDFDGVSSKENDRIGLDNIWKLLVGERIYS